MKASWTPTESDSGKPSRRRTTPSPGATRRRATSASPSPRRATHPAAGAHTPVRAHSAARSADRALSWPGARGLARERRPRGSPPHAGTCGRACARARAPRRRAHVSRRSGARAQVAGSSRCTRPQVAGLRERRPGPSTSAPRAVAAVRDAGAPAADVVIRGEGCVRRALLAQRLLGALGLVARSASIPDPLAGTPTARSPRARFVQQRGNRPHELAKAPSTRAPRTYACWVTTSNVMPMQCARKSSTARVP
jgi:hypothetical protein